MGCLGVERKNQGPAVGDSSKIAGASCEDRGQDLEGGSGTEKES